MSLEKSEKKKVIRTGVRQWYEDGVRVTCKSSMTIFLVNDTLIIFTSTIFATLLLVHYRKKS